MSHTVYASNRQQAAEAVALALAEGFSPEAVGEAISLAANQLVLHDPGRKKEDSPAKPIGSVHGASVGVHASDAANAWRNIARVSNRRNTVASMIVGAYHTAGQANGLNPKPYPFAEHREKVRSVAPDELLAEAETAIKAKDQVRACALVHRYGELGRPDGRSSTCCFATRSAKTALFTLRSTIARSAKSSPWPGPRSAGTIWRASPA